MRVAGEILPPLSRCCGPGGAAVAPGARSLSSRRRATLLEAFFRFFLDFRNNEDFLLAGLIFHNPGKAKSQRDRLTLHQPIRLRPQRCIQRCISQKAAYIFFGPVPPHPTTAQHTGPNTHSNTQHTHARSRRTCRRPDDWAAHLLHTSVRHVIVIHEGGWSTQELSYYTKQDPRGKNWAQRTASAAAQQTSQPAATPGDRWDPRVGSEGFHYIR